MNNGNSYIIVSENEVKLRSLASLCKDLYIPRYAILDGKQYLVTSIEPGKKRESKAYNVEKDGRKRAKWEWHYYDVDVNIFGKIYNCLRTVYPIVTINFHNAIRVIGDYAFSDVETFEPLTLNFPQSLEKIGKYAFSNCKKIEIETFPDSLITIGDYAFYGCEQIHSLVIPDSVSSIGAGAFYQCSKLKQITIGSGVKTIGENAFANCRELKVVHIYNDPFEIMVASNAFPYNAQIIYHKPDEPRRKYISDEKKKALSKLLGLEKFIVSNNSANAGQITDSNDRGKEPPVPVIDLDKLIDAVIADGVITDKERSVILKKATAAGYDADEVEILLDGKLAEKQNANKDVVKELQNEVAPVKKEVALAAKVAVSEEKSGEGTRNYSKYAVNGVGSYGKARMVEAVVKEYASRKNDLIVEDLKKAFPDHVIKSFKDGVKDEKRWYKAELKNGEQYYISNQWGNNIVSFIDYVHANIRGIEITNVE